LLAVAGKADEQGGNMVLIVGIDRQTSERAGAGGGFQIATLEDHEGNDLVGQVDQGRHFFSLEEARTYLQEKFGPYTDIEFSEEVPD
jgi:type I restriction enzyme S subunit